MLTALRVLNVAVWITLLAYMLPGAWAAVSQKGVRRADPMRLSVAAVCLVIILGNLRFLFAPNNEALFVAVYVFCAGVGLFKIWLARSYGRGPTL